MGCRDPRATVLIDEELATTRYDRASGGGGDGKGAGKGGGEGGGAWNECSSASRGDVTLMCGAGEAGWVYPVTVNQLLNTIGGAVLCPIHIPDSVAHADGADGTDGCVRLDTRKGQTRGNNV